MSRGTHERVSVVHLFVEYGIYRRDAAARGQQRDLVRAGPEWRLLPRLPTQFGAHLLDPFDVFLGVQAKDLVLGGRARLQLHEMIHEPADLEEVVNPALAFRAFDVPERLDGKARRHHPCTGAGVMPHVQLVPDKAGGHSSSVVSCGAAGLTSTAGGSGSAARYFSYVARRSGHRPCGAKTAIPARARPRISVW